jgi:hypothetical protein
MSNEGFSPLSSENRDPTSPEQFLQAARAAIADGGTAFDRVRAWALANEDRILAMASRNRRMRQAVRIALMLLKRSSPHVDGAASAASHRVAPPSASPVPAADPLAPSPLQASSYDGDPFATPAADPFEMTDETPSVVLEGPMDAQKLGDYTLTLYKYNLGTQLSTTGPTSGLYEIGHLGRDDSGQLTDSKGVALALVVQRVGDLEFEVVQHRPMPMGLPLLAPT